MTKTENKSDSVKEKAAQIPQAQLDRAKKLIAKVSQKDVEAVDAKKKYVSYCASCHGQKGLMSINGAKKLTKSTASLEESVAQIYEGKGMMTPFRGILKDEEIVAVARYIETFR